MLVPWAAPADGPYVDVVEPGEARRRLDEVIARLRAGEDCLSGSCTRPWPPGSVARSSAGTGSSGGCPPARMPSSRMAR